MTNTSFQGHVIASFIHLNQAEYYYDALKNLGYTDWEISIFVSEATKDRFADTNLDTSVTVTEAAGSWTMIWWTVWAIVWLILWLGSNAVVPWLGIAVTWPLLWALMWAGAWGATWWIIGALVWLGVNEDYAEKFKDDIENGNIVIAVDPKPNHKDKITTLAEDNKVHNLYCS